MICLQMCKFLGFFAHVLQAINHPIDGELVKTVASLAELQPWRF